MSQALYVAPDAERRKTVEVMAHIEPSGRRCQKMAQLIIKYEPYRELGDRGKVNDRNLNEVEWLEVFAERRKK